MAAASAHGLRMLVSLVIIKMIAVVLGPPGLGAIGNLLSVLSVVMVFAGGGIATGIAKYVAQYHKRPRRVLRLLETAFAIGFSVSGLILAISILAAQPIAVALFDTASLWWLSPMLGVAHFACFLGASTIAIANGQHRSDLFAAISISAYLGCIPAAFVLIRLFGFTGAAMALMLMAGCTALPSLWLLLRAPIRRVMRLRFHRPETGQLLRFSAMTLSSALTFPIAEILVRAAIIDELGLAQTGLWQASIRLSGAIMGFLTVYLATSYMPRLSALENPSVAFSFVRRTMMRIGLIFLLIALVLYAARKLVIPLLFSTAFAPLEPLLGWQLAGDLFRVSAYVIGFLVIARARLSLHIGAELLQYMLYAGISIAIVRGGGDLMDVVRGYALSYGLYFLITLSWLLLHGKRMR
jgi:PST family polysaccharide transporter/antigen flippase